jgi:putative membrane protein
MKMYWNHHGMMGGYWIMMFIFIMLVVLAVYLFMDAKTSKASSENGPGSYRQRFSEEGALEILNQRFAMGEIDQEVYQNKKKLLLQK